MISVIRPEKIVNKEPFYIIKFNYMIGDADGDTTFESQISLDNPYTEDVVKLMNSLPCPRGRIGLMLNFENINLIRENLTDEQYDLLVKLVCPYDVPYEIDEDIEVFHECIRSETDYSFLTLDDVELVYIDEYGMEYPTKII